MEDKDAIDIVIPWVDGSDEKWTAKKNKFLKDTSPGRKVNIEVKRFRDWDNLQYIFRGIEKYMPWVRKVHLVTDEQAPKWLNTKYSKLNLVDHKDFIPSKYLPLFSSTAIELNIHRINDLSEKFIYFNDDTFILKPQKPKDWFSRNGLPRDQFGLMRVANANYDDSYWHINFNNIGIINRNFDKITQTKRNFLKYFSLRNGLIFSLFSIVYFPPKYFPGFLISHQPNPFLKSTFYEVWDKEGSTLDSTSSNKFRSAMDVNQYLVKIWQLVSGNFMPKNWYSRNLNFTCTDESYVNIPSVFIKNKYDLFCLGDEVNVNFYKAKHILNNELDKMFPVKSGFEL